jgi:hypothetical protein
MDAAMNGFDIGHIAVTKTALAEINPLVDLQGPLLQLLDNLKIEVLKTSPKPPAPVAAKPEKTTKPVTATAPTSNPSSAPNAPAERTPAHPSVD